MTARQETKLVRDLVDPAYYAANNADVLAPGEDPVEHFCRDGWSRLRKPNPTFDVWWYWANHLDPGVDEINPLVHYAQVGRELGLPTRPSPKLSSGVRLPQDRPVRRACLFAGFDPQGILDESVLLFLQELARHADVFYLCDAYLPPEELAKLDGIATEAWSVRHGAYDFGSYSILARDLVGWDRLAAYDEVLFVNDSCFLVRPLDELFATMDARACDWWGLQATKGLASTRHNPRNGFKDPKPMETVRAEMLSEYEDDPVYDFHLGSYFLAFRRPVLDDPVFRRLIDSVHEQPSKLVVILKYEIGLTHLLVGRGHAFDTYVPALYPFHPMFTDWYFTLLEQGFPLLKRYFISQNHYDVPGLAAWKERVLAVTPKAPVDVFERTLQRTSSDDRLRRSLSITRRADGTVKVPRVIRGAAYKRRDAKVEKRPDVWAFAVDPVKHTLPDSSRALFEAVKDDPRTIKVVLTRAQRVDLHGENVVTEPLLSPAGREQLMRAGVVFVSANTRHALQARPSPERQLIVTVRDGLLLERQGKTAASSKLSRLLPEARGPLALAHPAPDPVATGIVVASDVDRLAALATYWPATFEQAWKTGLPSHDFLFCERDALPRDLHAQVAQIEAKLAGRRLLLFFPSRFGKGRRRYEFSAEERDHLRTWAAANDAVIGVRESGNDFAHPYIAQLGSFALDLSAARYPSTPAVLRAASAVMTDYAGSALDFAITGRPVMSFAHDLNVAQDGLLYDMDHFFPGPVARDFAALTTALETVFDGSPHAKDDRIRALLVDHRDALNTDRLLDRVRSLEIAR